MEGKLRFVPYEKASKTEKRSRDQLKRGQIKISSNKVHKSVKEYDRSDERSAIEREISELGGKDE